MTPHATLKAELAKEESDCSSHAKGGELGKFGRGKMQQPFEDAVRNETSQIIFFGVGVNQSGHCLGLKLFCNNGCSQTVQAQAHATCKV